MANEGYFRIANQAISSIFWGDGVALTSDDDMDVAHSRAVPITKKIIELSAQVIDRWKFCSNRIILKPVNDTEKYKMRDFTAISNKDNIFRLPSNLLRLKNCYSVNEDNTRGRFLTLGGEYNEIKLTTGEKFVISEEEAIYVNYIFNPPPQILEPFFEEWVVLQVIYKLVRDDNHTDEATKNRLVWEIKEAKRRAIAMNDDYGKETTVR